MTAINIALHYLSGTWLETRTVPDVHHNGNDALI